MAITLPGNATLTVQSLPFVGLKTAVGLEVSTVTAAGAGVGVTEAAAAATGAPLTIKSGGGASVDFSAALLRFCSTISFHSHKLFIL